MRRDPGGDARGRRPGRFQRADVACTSTAAARTASTAARRSCSSFDDQRLYRIDPGAEPVADHARRRGRRLTATPTGASRPTARSGSASASGTPRATSSADVVNELVAIPTDGSRRAARDRRAGATSTRARASRRTGRGSASSPGTSRGCRGTAASSSSPTSPPTATSSERRARRGRGRRRVDLAAGVERAGDLVFASDRSGWWNLERIRDGDARCSTPRRPSSAIPAGSSDRARIAFLGDGRIVCAYDSRRLHALRASSTPRPAISRTLDIGLDSVRGRLRRRRGDRRRSSSPARRRSRTRSSRVDARDRRDRDAAREHGGPGRLRPTSRRRAPIEFPTEDGRTRARALLPAHEPRLRGARRRACRRSSSRATAARPSNATPLFSLGIQFWTSRGFAVVDVNYGGSTGYGRAYRERLNGQWGVVDLQDCVNAARYLVEQGEADGDRLLITGGSAGGYTTICALTFTDVFAAGTTLLRDRRSRAVRAAARRTSSSSSTSTRSSARIRSEPSSTGRAARSTSPTGSRRPMLVLQGADDRVVPPSQAELIVDGARGARDPARVPPLRGRGARLPQGGEHRRLARGRALLLCAGPRLRARRLRYRGLRSSTSSLSSHDEPV